MTRGRLLLVVLPPAVALGLGALLSGWAGSPAQGPRATLWSVVFSEMVWAALAVSGAALATGADVADRLGLRRGRLRAGTLAVAAVGFIALSNALHLAIELLALGGTGTLGHLDAVVAHSRQAAPWLAILALGVAPGICEELLFRGLVQRIVGLRFGITAGVLAGALAFAIAHWDPIQSTAAFGLGVYLGALAELAGSTRASILCHVANNSLGVGLGLLGAAVPEGGGWGTVTGLSGLALGCLIWSAWRRRAAGR